MKRFLSLDVLRGLTVAGMILVNNPGSWGHIFAPLRHAAWDGCTPTDLVFPFFLFVVGAAVWFSNRRTDHRLTAPVVKKILRRGALIFVVGLLLNWYPFYSFGLDEPVAYTLFGQAHEATGFWGGLVYKVQHLRIMGVLQRIAIAFTLGALAALWLKSYRRIITATAVILLGYWALVMLTGDATLENYAGRYVDLAVFGDKHVYRGFGVPFDPEGLMNSIPAVATVLLGYMGGKLMGSAQGDHRGAIVALAAAGGLLVTLGLIWKGVFPLNKAIWSSSYVVYVGGLAMQVWAVLAWFTDYRGKTRWTTFFNVFGTNALFAFVLSGFLVKTAALPWLRFTVEGERYTFFSWLYHFYTGFASPEVASLLGALTTVALCWLITWPLYRKKIFIKL